MLLSKINTQFYFTPRRLNLGRRLVQTQEWLIVRKSFAQLQTWDLRLETGETLLRRDLFDRNIGGTVSGSRCSVGKFLSVQTLKYWSICHWHSHVNTVFLEGQKGKTGQNRTRSMMRILWILIPETSSRAVLPTDGEMHLFTVNNPLTTLTSSRVSINSK